MYVEGHLQSVDLFWNEGSLLRRLISFPNIHSANGHRQESSSLALFGLSRKSERNARKQRSLALPWMVRPISAVVDLKPFRLASSIQGH
jgi:hypothetical protein